MSSFGINLDLKLNGQSALDRAIRGTKTLESIVKRLKDTPLDLSNIGGAARLDEGRLGKARKGVIEFAKDLAKQEKPLANTEAGIREYVSAFNQLAANTKAGTPAFNAFVGVLAKAEKELEDIARATENARRAQLGLVSLEQEEAQKKRNQELQRNIELRKKRKKAIDDEARAQDRKNEKDAREARRERERQKRARSRKFTDIAAGVGFPLLFGGGPGAVTGGLVGGIAGGFGGSVLGGALGQQLDKLGIAAGNLGQALLKPTTNIDKLVQSLGISGSRLNSTIDVLRELGLESVASATAVDAFNDKFGVETANSLRALGKDFTEFQNALQTLGVRMAAFISGPLSAFLKTLSSVAGSMSNAESARLLRNNVSEQNRQQFDARVRELTGGAGFSGMITDEAMAKLIDEFDPAAAERKAAAAKTLAQAEKEITNEMNRRISVAQIEADVEKGKLTNRRDTQALLQADIGLKQASTEFERLELKLLNEQEPAKARLLALDVDLARLAKERAEAAKENARIQAERAIARDISSNEQAILQTFQAIGSVQRASLKITELEGEAFERNQTILKGESTLRLEALDLQREQALVGKTEQEVRDRINEKFDLAVRLEKRRVELQLEQNRQAEILRQNREQEIKDNRELLRLESERNAKLQIRSMDFGRKFELAGAGLGFFGESENFQEETFARTAAQLEAYNEQIAKLQERIEGLKEQKVDPDVILGEQFKLDDLVAVRNAYEQLQPQIDAAAVAQARFNDAMGVAVPVTDSLFDNLMSVVEGTQTAREAFASFLRDVASLLRETAKQMIAQYIAIGIARAFAFGSSGDYGTGSENPILRLPSSVGGVGYAEGGFVSGPTRALVGEGGESEYIIPESKMRESMARYSRGARGSAVIPDSGVSGTSSEGGGTAVAAPIDVRYTVERINSVDYVTANQFQRGLQQAAAQGATQGEQRALTTLRQNTSQRRRIGL